MATIEQNDNWINFINEYKNARELWDVQDVKYKTKSARAKAYERLVHKYKHIDKDANVVKVKNRIKNMRATYRRELKKKNSIERSCGEIYEPNLWYFSLFDFLGENVFKGEGKDAAPSSGDENVSSRSVVSREIQRPQPKKKKTNNSTDELVRLVTKRLKSPQDSSHYLGIAWADKLSKMKRNQRIIAEKIVNEVMFNGELGLLNFNTSLTNISSTSSLNPPSFSLNKNDAIVHSYGESSLDSNPPTNNIKIQRQVNAYSPPSVIDESITDNEHDHSERNFVVLECDPLDGSVKMEA